MTRSAPDHDTVKGLGMRRTILVTRDIALGVLAMANNVEVEDFKTVYKWRNSSTR